MASAVIFRFPLVLSFFFFVFFSGLLAAADVEDVSLAGGTWGKARLRTYIVHVQPPPLNLRGEPESREAYHRSFLPVHPVDSGEQRLLYSYEHVISGFAARLTSQDLAAVEMKDGFLAAYPDELIPLQTTRSSEFLGLRSSGAWNRSNLGAGVIIGVLDTGIRPDHPSFACDLPPPRSSWKGTCEFGPNGCTKKIIGARGFAVGLRAMMLSGEIPGEVDSLGAAPFDQQGHGTHVASTAAGCFVNGANSYGQATGTAVGVAPSAYISVYKVCGAGGCPSSDILAGLDASITDGVDIASLSLGGPPRPFYTDSIAIGTFSAVAKGIFVSIAGGNDGPRSGSVSNEGPWMLTVAASTQDRSLRATVRLGSGSEFDGEALVQLSSFPTTQISLVSGGSCTSLAASVQGKVVLCDISPFIGRAQQGQNVLNARGVAMILANSANEGNTIMNRPDVLPTSQVSFSAGAEIKRYITSASSPTAAIVFKGTVIGGPFTPAIAYFSSRGPSTTTPGILKPDIAGPGFNVLAAWPTPVGTPGATSLFNIISGTSMATPHLSGAAALVKAANPTWSPSAIKSAIMTSATQTDSSGKPIEDHRGNPATPFDMGAGQIDVRGAIDTRVVYEVSTNEYIAYLCGLRYTNQQVTSVVGRAVTCSTAGSVREDELNYPSFRISLNSAGNFTRRVTRTLTNLGPSATTCTWLAPTGLTGVSAAVQPTTLTFSAGEKKQYTATFSRSGSGTGTTLRGLVGWSCNGAIHRSAAVVSF